LLRAGLHGKKSGGGWSAQPRMRNELTEIFVSRVVKGELFFQAHGQESARKNWAMFALISDGG